MHWNSEQIGALKQMFSGAVCKLLLSIAFDLLIYEPAIPIMLPAHCRHIIVDRSEGLDELKLIDYLRRKDIPPI